jgi:murein DD-endopeptidase MepM/ murein hydrolase activator NlpD
MTTNGRHTRNGRKKALRIAIKLGVSLLIAIALNLFVTSITETPKMSMMQQEHNIIEDKFTILQQKIASARRTVNDIIQRDHEIYRPLLDIDTLNIPKIYAEYNDSKYSSLAYDARYGEQILKAWRDIDQLTRLMYYASLCLDETQHMAEYKQEFTLVIPAIWPIDRTKLRNISSRYGPRLHPKLGYTRMHEGIDITAPIGTDVYATGDAVVTRAGWQNGYGNIIELNHGFGYRTRYAHLSSIYVILGDSIKRGQTIGAVGNTGISTGPHLHYEVHYRGNHVDPINYFDQNIDTASYRDLMQQITQEKSNNGQQ